MSDRTCATEDCERAGRLRRSLCDMHYARLLRTGDAGEAEKRRLPAPDQCTVEGCANDFLLIKGLCQKHRARLMRYGDVNANPRAVRGWCRVIGCGRRHEARGYCTRHYWMWWRHGDPEPGGYAFAHYKVHKIRGLAAGYPCAHCGAQARHWAYDHADPGERRDPRRGGPYSLDPDHYLPLCVSCHRRFDWKMNGARMGSYLGRDAILKASALRTEEVHVPEWIDPESGADVVLVRELRGRERDEWEASLAVQRGRQMVPDVANMRAKLVAMVVVGEDLEPLFSRQDVAALGELSAAALDRVFEAAAKLSALNQDAVEEMGKNSGTAP